MTFACSQCIYFESVDNRDPSNLDPSGRQRLGGRCRRHPPILRETAYTSPGVWPYVKDTDWCGEGRTWEVEQPLLHRDPPPRRRSPDEHTENLRKLYEHLNQGANE